MATAPCAGWPGLGSSHYLRRRPGKPLLLPACFRRLAAGKLERMTGADLRLLYLSNAFPPGVTGRFPSLNPAGHATETRTAQALSKRARPSPVRRLPGVAAVAALLPKKVGRHRAPGRCPGAELDTRFQRLRALAAGAATAAAARAHPGGQQHARGESWLVAPAPLRFETDADAGRASHSVVRRLHLVRAGDPALLRVPRGAVAMDAVGFQLPI